MLFFVLLCVVSKIGFLRAKNEPQAVFNRRFPSHFIRLMNPTDQLKRSKGRPSKAEQGKSERLTSRFTAEEYAALTTKAAVAGLKITQLGRELILKGTVTNLFSSEEQADKKQLIGLSNNLNQIAKNLNYFAKHFNMESVSSQVLKIDNYLDSIDAILKKYNQ